MNGNLSNNGAQEQLLYVKKGLAKIIVCRLFLGWTGLLHIVLLAVLVNLMPGSFIKSIGMAGFFGILFLIFVVPYVLHALYISVCKVGYAEFHTNSVQISTKVQRKEFAFGTKLKMKVVGHRVGAVANPMYFVIKMVFEQNGKKERMSFYTTDLSCFDAVVKCFRHEKV